MDGNLTEAAGVKAAEKSSTDRLTQALEAPAGEAAYKEYSALANDLVEQFKGQKPGEVSSQEKGIFAEALRRMVFENPNKEVVKGDINAIVSKGISDDEIRQIAGKRYGDPFPEDTLTSDEKAKEFYISARKGSLSLLDPKNAQGTFAAQRTYDNLKNSAKTPEK